MARMLAVVSWLLFAAAASAAAATAEGFGRDTTKPIAVAFVITDMANVIDFAGPWEVFQDTAIPGTESPAFRLYTVGDSRRPVHLTGGLTVVPDYTFDDAPTPAVVVVGAQHGSARLREWLRAVHADARTDALMSVCTGAFRLADAGLLDGTHATTHHDFADELARRYPRITVERDARFVQSGPHLFTAGGLTSGIDLALHIVARYHGEAAALATARYMEYRRAQP